MKNPKNVPAFLLPALLAATLPIAAETSAVFEGPYEDIAHLSVYDPRENKILLAKITGGGDKTLSVRLPAADYPRFLLVIEDQPGPLILEPELSHAADGKTTLTFKTNLPVEPRVTTGPVPDRVGGKSLALPRGTRHTVELSLEDKHGVRVAIEHDGLTCVWPRWGWDVQGVIFTRNP